MDTVLFLLLFSPLAGALTLALFGRYFSRRAVETIACTSVLSACLLALTGMLMFSGKAHVITLGSWFSAGGFQVDLNLYYDAMAAVMALMVTFVSSLVHIYSVAYMRHEDDYVRYFSFLNLFVFAMLVIIVAGNLVFMYLGWETVGFCSYALIGFWYLKPEAASAGRKAFVVTRLGDVAFGVAIALCWVTFGQLNIGGICDGAAGMGTGTATVLGLLLVWAALGKSAQLPLSVWLPDAMAGPTPVSALIHAATMVTAGVYLLMRFFPVIQASQMVMAVIAFIGVATVCYGALAALVQKDIKRILAFSTISQVGYMFLAVGAGDLAGSLFHLLSHAFFKSLLFLAAGCIIQVMHEEQNIFRMAGLRQKEPQLFWLFLAGTLALAAFPLSSGFFSKDRILAAVFLQPHLYYKLLWFIAMLSAMITPLYAFRLFFVVFYGKTTPDAHCHPLASIPGWMTAGLWPLAFLSLFSGYLNLPAIWNGHEWLVHFLSAPGAGAEMGATSHLEWTMELGSGGITVIMVLVAWMIYGQNGQLDEHIETRFSRKLHNLFWDGFYLDRLYQAGVVVPYRKLADFLWQKVDENWLDDRLDQGALSVLAAAERLRLWTSGQISRYLAMMITGFTLIVFGMTAAWWYF